MFTLIILFAVVLHYSITLQYSAYFHIYFKIAKRYEENINEKNPELKARGVFKQWLMGFFKLPKILSSNDDE